jgi:hypothetical protein
MDANAGAPPTLEDLARAKFGHLAEPELRLIRGAREGEVVECSPSPQDPKAPDNDPGRAESWNEQHNIRAAIIRWLCVGADAAGQIDPRGIWIHAARIVGNLDLGFASVPYHLRFFKLQFPGRDEC